MSLISKSSIASLFLLVTICCQQEQGQVDGQIVIGERASLESAILNETRPYWVYVPPHKADDNRKFAVLYLLDGDAHFHSVTGLIQILGSGVNGTYVLPEMIVVAIPNLDRTKDLTPSHSEIINGEQTNFLKSSGGGPNFLKFIEDELIPHIDSKYPTTPYRVLVGHSFGGITTINALYTIPEAFDAYISIDPSLWWDNQSLLKKADSVFMNSNLENKSLFIGQANTLNPGETTNEHFGSIKEYVKVLEEKNKSGLRWAYKYYPDDSHGSVPFISEYDGLRFIFADYNPSFEKAGTNPDRVDSIFAKYYTTVPERIANSFGYQAMALKNFDLAYRYFQMNIDAYPTSANVFDSMGEYWMNKGDTTKAIDNYNKSLLLDPTNDNAKAMIKKMNEGPLDF